ncbi:MAG TPA: hypothetical protein VLY04_23820 [Bryobacteraceae bacterium]|nr:hypothetical protein [Bryobacteraceae bacterium]
MRAIGVEETAAIGAQVLDEFQRCHRSLRDGLGSTLQGSRRDVRVEVQRDALPEQNQAAHQRQRQQDPEQRPRQVHPEIAQRGRALAGDAADEGESHRQARRTGEKILRYQADQLGHVAQRALTAVGLPGGGGGETHRGVGGAKSFVIGVVK